MDLVRRLCLLALSIPATLATSSAFAEAPPVDEGATFALARTDAEVLVLELGGAGAIALASAELVETPSACRWCAPSEFDRAVHGAFVWSDRRAAATLSHLVSAGLVPLLALGVPVGSAVAGGRTEYAWQDAAVILSPFLLVTGLTEATKRLVARERPDVYYGTEGLTEYAASPGERFLSFYSADVARAWALGSSAATVCWLRGYPAAPYVTVASAALGIGTAFLRLGADVHWATDVAAGAVVGTAFGVGLPLLLHGRSQHRLQASLSPLPTSHGMMVSLNGEF